MGTGGNACPKKSRGSGATRQHVGRRECARAPCAGPTRFPAGCPGCRLRTWAFAFSCSSCTRQLHSSRPIALHRSISTVPRIILNQSLISCYPSSVFADQNSRRLVSQPTLLCFLQKITNSFRMTSLARLWPLTPIESYPCMKTPGGHPLYLDRGDDLR